METIKNLFKKIAFNSKHRINIFYLFLVALLSPTIILAKDFNDTIIYINPFSWDELQLLQPSHMKSNEELNLSDQCPDTLEDLEDLNMQGSFFKEVLWTNYFWTSFVNNDGLLCVVKHNTFNFFTEEFDSTKQDGAYEILSEVQARILLSAIESLGFDEKGIEILKRNVSKHNSAVASKKFAAYGGRIRMQQFLEYYPAEKTPIPYVEGVTFLERFVSSYSDETLQLFKRQVLENPTPDKNNGKYPFNSLEELLNEVREQITLTKESKK